MIFIKMFHKIHQISFIKSVDNFVCFTKIFGVFMMFACHNAPANLTKILKTQAQNTAKTNPQNL
ncbi:hypothetical protein B0181_07075 [Moraxella caviae]|uniref:Uncharacterized protein n=1 Tax=Moraxella caviae TaxID=34060 RepID=A0A1T0A110_9GAMM|nr:hypothetical protein B0181_07075 [Moraxella caviae]